MLEVKNISIEYSPNIKLLHIDYVKFDAGSCYALLGKNGSGKSSLLKTLSGIISKKKESIFWNGQALTFPTSLISYIPPRPTFPPQHTVYTYVSLGMARSKPSYFTYTEDEKKMVLHVLNLLNIEHLKNTSIEKLSDGQKQKALLAQSFLQKSSVLLLDEPLQFLDHESKLEFILLLEKLAHDQNKCILYSTHDLYYIPAHTPKIEIQNKSLIWC